MVLVLIQQFNVQLLHIIQVLLMLNLILNEYIKKYNSLIVIMTKLFGIKMRKNRWIYNAHVEMSDQLLNFMVVKKNGNGYWAVLKHKEIVQLMDLLEMSIGLKCKEKDRKKKTRKTTETKKKQKY